MGFGEGVIPAEDSPFYKTYNKTGDRIATFMGWLSDTKEGGKTCFTQHLGEGCFTPIKGAGVFWININRKHKRDDRLSHGGCPVLLGTKDVVNDWIYSLAQWKNWKCSTDENSEFSVNYDFLTKPHQLLVGPYEKKLKNYSTLHETQNLNPEV